MKNDYNNCAILISSCDNYSDLWIPFFDSFNRFWPDCSFKKYLITEIKVSNFNGVKDIVCGSNKNWSDRLHYALSQIEQEYVILFLEDFFLRSKIDNEKVVYFLKILQNQNYNFIRLIKRPRGYLLNKDIPSLNEIHSNDNFRVSTQVGIWKKQVLLKIIKFNENIWQFEKNGTERANKLKDFYCVKNDVMTYKHHVVERGKWFPWYAIFFKYIHKLNIDLNKRKLMNFNESIIWLLNKFLAKKFSLLPKFLKKPIRFLAIKLKIYVL